MSTGKHEGVWSFDILDWIPDPSLRGTKTIAWITKHDVDKKKSNTASTFLQIAN